MRRGTQWKKESKDGSPRVSRDARRISNNPTQQIYQELLEEVLQEAPSSDKPRALKRRKSQRVEASPIVEETSKPEAAPSRRNADVVVISSSSGEESSNDEEEMEWDDVVLHPTTLDDGQISPIEREVTLSRVPERSRLQSSIRMLIDK